MYAILEALQQTISKNILGEQVATQPVIKNATEIKLPSARRYKKNDTIAVYEPDGEKAETTTIKEVLDGKTIRLSSGVQRNYKNARTQKIYCGKFIQPIIIGNPPSLPHYPAITIESVSEDDEPLASGGTMSTEFVVSITTWIDDQEFSQGYRLLHLLTKHIANVLRFNYRPLLKPFCYTTLSIDESKDEILIGVEDDSVINEKSEIWIENEDTHLGNFVKKKHGSGVVELEQPLGKNFEAGSKVITPSRHVYNSQVVDIEYGRAAGNLFFGSITYQAKTAFVRSSTGQGSLIL